MSECTVVILARNEASRIGGAIGAARDSGFAVLVVDSGSTDGTEEVARDAGASVTRNPFADFAAQRNWAMDQVDSPYVLFVDADELVPKELATEIAGAVADGVDGATIPTLDYFAGRWLLHGGAFPQRHVRLLRRAAARFEGEVHERVEFERPAPLVVDLETPLLHLSHLRLTNYIQKLDRYTETEAGAMAPVSSTRAVLRGAAEAIAVLGDRVVRRSAWRDGAHGMVAAVSYAFYRFTIHAKAATKTPVDEPTLEAGMSRWRSNAKKPASGQGH